MSSAFPNDDTTPAFPGEARRPVTPSYTGQAGYAERTYATHEAGATSAEDIAHRTAHDPVTGAPADPARLSLGDTLSAVSENLSALVRGEIALAKAEATQSAKNAGKGAGMLAGAAVAGLITLIFLTLAIAWAIGALLDVGLGWGAFVVALLWAAAAAVLALQGKKDITNVGMPRTQDTAARIPGALKGEETR